ncbi:hypothetical protein WT49_07465 [Burkholderia territorii]|nr:hypothetical protein WT50_31110 [Burkholderia territorii]KWE39753.1 hypothetical protein WT49_07465 [Burkholderia territorii]KWE42914.1 hypothetical protein WT51_01940 [Burkholderia territorii]
MGSRAGFHDNRHGFQISEERQELGARQPLAKYLVTLHVLRMQMKHMLAQIDTDQRDLVHGALLYRGPNFLS